MRTQTAWLAVLCAALVLVGLARADKVARGAGTRPPPADGLNAAARNRPALPGDAMQTLGDGCGPHCHECGDDGVCKKCVDRYGKTSDGKCAPCPDNCLSCDGNPTICAECEAGYGKTSDNKCERCFPNCVECADDATKCKKCDNGYRLNSRGDGCEVNCDDNCLKCKDAHDCEICKAGYRLNQQGECDPCSVVNCAKCDDDTGKCTECNGGFRPSTDLKTCGKSDGASKVFGPLFVGVVSALTTAVLV